MRTLKKKTPKKIVSKSTKSTKLKKLKALKQEKLNAKSSDTSNSKLPVIIKKKKKRYKKQKCAFVDSSGKQCHRLAVGKSTLCKVHGGNPVIKENLITTPDNFIDYPNSKFDPAIHPLSFIDFARSGYSDVEIAAQFEVSADTMKKWAEKYESFNKAYEIGQAMQEAWWLEQGKNNLNARSFNTPLFKFLTMNKLGYSDKIEQKNLNTNVHGVLLIPDAVTAEEWEAEEMGEVIDVN